MVKGYHECSFAVGVGEKFVIKKKGGDSNSLGSCSEGKWLNLDICNMNWCLYFGHWPTKLKCKALFVRRAIVEFKFKASHATNAIKFDDYVTYKMN